MGGNLISASTAFFLPREKANVCYKRFLFLYKELILFFFPKAVGTPVTEGDTPPLLL